MDKELLIREYFALKYKFAKLHNSEVLFKEKPTNDEIKITLNDGKIEVRDGE